MSNKPLKVGDTVKTLGGYPARIICDDRKGQLSLISLINDGTRIEKVHAHYPNGRDGERLDNENSPYNLIKVHKRKVWLNINPEMTAVYHNIRDAEQVRSPFCLACVEVEVEFYEGEGL